LYDDDCDFAEWSVDEKGDLTFEGIHHDGHNYYTYRAIKDDATAWKIAELQDRICNGTATDADIERVTYRIGDIIAKVYGWQLTA
jgi:hypothetical protein